MALFDPVVYPIEPHVHGLGLFWRNSLVTMPTAVNFSTWMAVGPCGHPISDRVVRMGTAVWALMKMVPYSASAADAMILRMILHMTSKMPSVVGTKSSGFLGSGGPSAIKMDSAGSAYILSN